MSRTNTSLLFLVVAPVLGCGGDDMGSNATPDGSVLTTGAEQLAEGQRSPQWLLVDDTGVYWTTGGADPSCLEQPCDDLDAGVQFLARGRSAPSELASETAAPTSLASDGTTPFWTTAEGSIRKVPLGGGDVSSITTGQTHASQLRLTEDRMYWFSCSYCGPTSGNSGQIFRQPKDGAAAATSIGYWMPTTGLAIGESNTGGDVVYVGQWYPAGIFGGTSTGQIAWIANDGQTNVLYQDTVYLVGPTLQEDRLYFATTTQIMSMRRAAQAPTILAPAAGAVSLILDDDYVYWTERDTLGGDGRVMRVAKEGGEPTVLADGQNLPATLAQDDDYVYWTARGTLGENFADGSVWRVAKD